MFIRYHLIYYAISCLLVLLIKFVHPVFIVFLIVYGIFIIKRLNKETFILMIILSIIFLLVLQMPNDCNEPKVSGKIVNLDEKYIVLKTDKTKIRVYGQFDGYSIDDKLVLEIEYLKINEPTNDNAFNYKLYSYSQGIFYNAKLIRIIESTKINSLFNKLENRIKGNDLSNSYASMFILGIKDNLIKDNYLQLSNLSIVHLFALSGLHIALLQKTLKKILIYVIPERYIDYICVLIIGIYMYIIPYNISFTRAYLVMLLYTFFSKYLNKLDCLSIVFIMMVIVNPYVIFSLSFIFSYFLYLIILLINNHKYMNLLVYLGSIPIILNINYRLNILSILLTSILSPFISVFYQLLWLYVLVGDLAKGLVDIMVVILNNIIVFSSNVSLYINFSKPNLLFLLAYYFVYFKLILKINVRRAIYREMMMLFCLVLMFYLYPYYQLKGQVVMIDVGQGDCFLIQEPFNQGNILIDTGGLKNRDLATTTLIPYLHSIGIYKLDYVFLSHDDFDHSGAYDSLAKQINIDNTIRSYQDKVIIGNIVIEMLKVPESHDSNDNSLVLLVTINHLKYLFTGDISSEVESYIINNYPNLKIDVLKVSHHGSKNSTCSEFLGVIKPKVALISCGNNNIYHHPHDEVIQRLNDYGLSVYRSDSMGMVKIVYYGDDNYIYQ